MAKFKLLKHIYIYIYIYIVKNFKSLSSSYSVIVYLKHSTYSTQIRG